MARFLGIHAFLVTGMVTARVLAISFRWPIILATPLLHTGKPVHPNFFGTTEASASLIMLFIPSPSSQNIKSDVPCQGDATRHTHNCH